MRALILAALVPLLASCATTHPGRMAEAKLGNERVPLKVSAVMTEAGLQALSAAAPTQVA